VYYRKNGDIDIINGLGLKALELERNYLKNYYKWLT
jgi:hypothetical protein